MNEKTKQEIASMIIDHLAEVSGIAPYNIQKQNKLIHDLYMDSLDKMEFIMWMETTFGVKITWQQGEELRTVGQAINLVLNYRTTD